MNGAFPFCFIDIDKRHHFFFFSRFVLFLFFFFIALTPPVRYRYIETKTKIKITNNNNDSSSSNSSSIKNLTQTDWSLAFTFFFLHLFYTSLFHTKSIEKRTMPYYLETKILSVDCTVHNIPVDWVGRYIYRANEMQMRSKCVLKWIMDNVWWHSQIQNVSTQIYCSLEEETTFLYHPDVDPIIYCG